MRGSRGRGEERFSGELSRHYTDAAHFRMNENGVSIRELPGCAGEIGFTSTVSPPRTATDVLGFYDDGRYHWGRLISLAYEALIRLDTLIPSCEADTGRKLGRARAVGTLWWGLDRMV
jgi:hypothetical protein